MINVQSCVICNSNKISNFIELQDYFYTNESFVIDVCNSCGYKFTNPYPEISNLGSYYKSENYISHTDNKNSLFFLIYQMVRRYSISKKFRILKKYLPSNNTNPKVMDYGCATGEFLSFCRKNNCQVVGVEPDEQSRNYASKKHNISVLPPDKILELEDNNFDVITLWHVLEHIPDLNEKLTKIHNLLKNNGVAVIAVPNCDSYDAKYYNKFWAGYDVPRHLHHFNHKTITHLLNNNNFEVLCIKPMIFDSFYASILSENYKKNKIPFIKGSLIGLFSNISAMKTKNYSSAIYIVTKKRLDL